MNSLFRDLPYVAVFIATIIEGEALFIAACVLVSLGRLNPAGVFLAAALGGSLGDQIYFYCLRGRLRRWLGRFIKVDNRNAWVAEFVKRHSVAMILACRFLPGLRVAIPIACAYSGVSSARFTSLSLVSSAGWAAAILLIVSHFGPSFLTRFGLDAWWASLLPALFLLALLLSWHLRTRSGGRPYLPGFKRGRSTLAC
jgi:membrane protein DedA with SNARE-associated domain